jgi:hypothetical protein
MQPTHKKYSFKLFFFLQTVQTKKNQNLVSKKFTG